MTGTRSAFVVLALGVIATLFIATASAVTPSNGVYQGIQNGSQNTNGHNEGEGYFRVKNGTNGRKIVPSSCTSSSCQILMPIDPAYPCNYGNRLSVSIPISAGTFDYIGKAPQGPGSAMINVHFKGAWVSASKVKGYTRTWTKNCDTLKMFWTMKTPPPA
jgi:hypothetical protein